MNRRWMLALPVVFAVTVSATAQGRTDIRKVDEFIDAPRALFGETPSDVLRTLGPPAAQDTRRRETYRDPTVTRVVQRLTFAGVVVELSTRLVRLELTAPGYSLPWGLDVGTPRQTVESVLGEPQRTLAGSVLYLYSDGFPQTVTFHFADNRVRKIEWEYWID